MSGGVPVTPVNVALRRRQLEEGSTIKSLKTYARAARLYVEFCAHRHQALIDISNEEFVWFKRALLGESFLNAEGERVNLSGNLGRRTADLMLTLLYALAADIEERYEVSFDWRRYKNLSRPFSSASLPSGQFPRTQSGMGRRSHHIRWIPRKIVGLPNDQFVELLRAAYTRWGREIADGDVAYAEQPEEQKGALFYRNVALLLVLRFAGSRRSEVTRLRFGDIDRSQSLLYLPTKGHVGERLPVLMIPWVHHMIWLYVTHFRPVTPDQSLEDRQALFVSHSASNYGQQLSDESVRSIVDLLRSTLTPPWSMTLTPHMLRHSYGYDLQKLLGPLGVTANMRHASSRSGEPYAAGPQIFADELLGPSNEKLAQLFTQADLLEKLEQQLTQAALPENFHED